MKKSTVMLVVFLIVLCVSAYIYASSRHNGKPVPVRVEGDGKQPTGSEEEWEMLRFHDRARGYRMFHGVFGL